MGYPKNSLAHYLKTWYTTQTTILIWRGFMSSKPEADIAIVYYGLEIEPTKNDFAVFRMLSNEYGKDFVVGVILDLGPQLLAQKNPLSYLCGAVKGQAKKRIMQRPDRIQHRAQEIESFITKSANGFLQPIKNGDLQ